MINLSKKNVKDTEKNFKFVNYRLAANCQNTNTYHTCLKCEACGRKFDDVGIIKK